MSEEKAVQILVTGGSGFLGGEVVELLLERHPEWRISALDIRLPKDGIDERLEQFFKADITSVRDLDHVLDGYHPDLVIHTAGIVPARQLRYSTREADWQRVKAINADGTKNVLDWALAAGCKRFVYTSSCTAVTDDSEHDYYYMNESVPIGLVTLYYGRSKGMAEAYVLSSSHREKGLLACALRPSTIIGPQDTQVISVMHDCIAKGETKYIVGSGDNIYDFMYISNAVDAHLLAAENLLTTQTAVGEAFFISNQEPVYFWDFLAAVWAQFGHYPPFRVRIPGALGLVAGYLMEWITWATGNEATLDRGSVKDGDLTRFSNNDKARRILGYVPKVGLAEGLRRSCDGYKRQLAAKAAQGAAQNGLWKKTV